MNWSFVPAGTPHFAASVQLVTPFGSTFQPCDVSSAIAFFGLYGYGFCDSNVVENEFFGRTGTGPYVGTP